MQNEDAASKLKTVAFMLKFGHDLFSAPDIDAVAAMAVNDTRTILAFRNAALFEVGTGSRLHLLGQFAQSVCNPHSSAAEEFAETAGKADFENQDVCIVPAGDGKKQFLCNLLKSPGKDGSQFIWLLEYENTVPESMINAAKLLGRSIAEALVFAKLSASSNLKRRKKIKRAWKYVAVIVLLAAAMFIPVPDSTTAEFALQPEQTTAAYAWFDGPIAQCFKQDGDTVRKGERIARYDTAQLEYKLADARSSLQETEAELALEQQNAFTDESKLGKTKLLQAKCDSMKVAVKEAEWFLAHADITAPADGILALTDRRAEQLTGKAVRTGDKLFEIFSTGNITAKILVPEQNSSILQKKFSARLFLYTKPEQPIDAEVMEIAAHPELTDRQTYCYPVTVKLASKELDTELRFGMRGTAKLYGEKTFAGYYLVKNLILCIRKW